MLADESGVVLVGHEADFLAVAFRGHAQAQPLGDPANLLLAILADRKHQPRQQLPLDAEQHVGLVLRRVEPAAQGDFTVAVPTARLSEAVPAGGTPSALLLRNSRHALRRADQPGVMARGHVLGPEPSAYSNSLPNFSHVLQTMHGLGVRPAVYSATK